MGWTFVLEWGGSLVGLLGAALLAAGGPNAGRGFVAFLISNMCWIAYGLLQDATGLVVMQIGFTATSLLGIRNWRAAKAEKAPS